MKARKTSSKKTGKEQYQEPKIEKVRLSSGYRLSSTQPGGDTSPHSFG